MREKILMLVVMLGIVLVSALGCKIDSTYTREGVVLENTDGACLIEDKSGNLWEYGSYKLEKGDNVKMIMFNGFTDNKIIDDEITRVRVIKSK